MTIPNPMPAGWELTHFVLPPFKIDEWWVCTDEQVPSCCCQKLAPVAYPVDPETHTKVGREYTKIPGIAAAMNDHDGVAHCAMRQDGPVAKEFGLTKTSDLFKALNILILTDGHDMPPALRKLLVLTFLHTDQSVETTVDNPDGSSVTAIAGKTKTDKAVHDAMVELIAELKEIGDAAGVRVITAGPDEDVDEQIDNLINDVMKVAPDSKTPVRARRKRDDFPLR